MGDDRKTYGTADLQSPISRDDFERALRMLNATNVDARDLLLRLAAQVVALTEQLEVSEAVGARLPSVLERIRKNDATVAAAWIETDLEDKYSVTGPDIPCDELIPLCKAKCCTFYFALSTADLDEGVLRWDYGRPYMIRQRASDRFCVHNDPVSHGCTVHAHRPMVCRRYDCREDKRIWADYENRVVAPPDRPDDDESPEIDLVDMLRKRDIADAIERGAVTGAYPDDGPRVGPPPLPSNRRMQR